MAATMIFIIGFSVIMFGAGGFCGYYRGYDQGFGEALDALEKEIKENYHYGKE